MLIVIGGLLVAAVAIVIGRLWLIGNWFGASMMFLPFAGIFAGLLFGASFSLLDSRYARDNLVYEAAHPPRTWTVEQCKMGAAQMSDEEFLFCTGASTAVKRLDRTNYVIGPVMGLFLSIAALVGAFCAARAPKWYRRRQADLLIHPRAPLRKLPVNDAYPRRRAREG